MPALQNCTHRSQRLKWGAKIQIIIDNCVLLFGGLGDGGAPLVPSAAAKEKGQMPRTAFVAAEWPHEHENEDGPFQHAVPM